MRKALILFALTTSYLYYNGKPFDQPPVAVVAETQQQPQLLPSASAQVVRPVAIEEVASTEVAFKEQPRFAAGLAEQGYRHRLNGAQIAYRYALTDGERQATDRLLPRMIESIRPAPTPRLVTDTRQLTTSADLRYPPSLPGAAASRTARQWQSQKTTQQADPLRLVSLGASTIADLQATGSAPDALVLPPVGTGPASSDAALAMPTEPVGDGGVQPGAQQASGAVARRSLRVVRAAGRSAAAKVVRRERSARRSTRVASRERRLSRPYSIGPRFARISRVASYSRPRRKAFGFHVVAGSISFNPF